MRVLLDECVPEGFRYCADESIQPRWKLEKIQAAATKKGGRLHRTPQQEQLMQLPQEG
jgi:hypothetical protein